MDMEKGGKETGAPEKTGKTEQKKSREEVPKAVEIPEESIPEEEIFVMPGDLVGTAEEFTAGEGTYVNKGDIYSIVTGNVMIDKKKRVVSVVPNTSTPPVIKEGDIVIGEVTNVRDSVVLVSLVGIKGVEEREFQTSGLAAIHVSNVSDRYVKDLSKEFSISDIVKAKVLNIENMRLDTSDKFMGVMKANCSRCKTDLVKEDNKLKCPVCGNVETRKISSDYGTGVI